MLSHPRPAQTLTVIPFSIQSGRGGWAAGRALLCSSAAASNYSLAGPILGMVQVRCFCIVQLRSKRNFSVYTNVPPTIYAIIWNMLDKIPIDYRLYCTCTPTTHVTYSQMTWKNKLWTIDLIHKTEICKFKLLNRICKKKGICVKIGLKQSAASQRVREIVASTFIQAVSQLWNLYQSLQRYQRSLQSAMIPLSG